jgi:hypothetical protein
MGISSSQASYGVVKLRPKGIETRKSGVSRIFNICEQLPSRDHTSENHMVRYLVVFESRPLKANQMGWGQVIGQLTGS